MISRVNYTRELMAREDDLRESIHKNSFYGVRVHGQDS